MRAISTFEKSEGEVDIQSLRGKLLEAANEEVSGCIYTSITAAIVVLVVGNNWLCFMVRVVLVA